MADSRATDVLQRYQDIVARTGTRVGRWWWWGTHLASKNRFTSGLAVRLGEEQRLAINPVAAIACFCRSLARVAKETASLAWRIRRVRCALPTGAIRLYSHYDVVFKTFTYAGSVSGRGEYHDPFFGALPLWTARRTSCLVLTQIIGDYPRVARRLGRVTDVRVVPFECLLGLLDVVWVFGTAMRATLALLPRQFDITVPIAARVSLKDDSPQISVTQLIMYRAMRRLCQKTSFGRYVQTYENNPWEKMAIAALRKFGRGTIVVGYQHAAVPQASVNMFLSGYENRRMPLPDLIVTTGPEPLEIMRRYSSSGGPHMLPACGLRYEYLHDLVPADRRATGRVLVALEGVPQAARLATTAIAAAKIAPDAHFVLRFHPALPYSALADRLPPRRNWPTNVNVSRAASVVDDLQTADMCYYWGSTVAIEAQMLGLPAIHHRIDSVFSFDPLFATDDFRWVVSTPHDLADVIHVITTLSEAEYAERRRQARDYVRRYFAPVSEECLSTFLDAVPMERDVRGS